MAAVALSLLAAPENSVDIMFTLGKDNTMAIDLTLGDEDPVEFEADNSQPII